MPYRPKFLGLGAQIGFLLGTVSLSVPAFAASYEFDDIFGIEGGRPRSPSESVLSPTLGAATLAGISAAMTALNDSRFEDAEKLARAVTVALPDAAEGWHLLGLALANLGRIDEGITALDTAGNLYTENSDPFVIEGDLLLSVGRKEDARAAYLKAVKRDASNWRGQEGLASLALQDGDLDLAIRSLEFAVGPETPDRLPVRLQLSRLYLDTGRADDAISLLNSYTNANREDAKAAAALGHAYLIAKKPEMAAPEFGRAAELVPDDPSLLLLQSRALQASNDFVSSEAVLETALERFPDTPEVYSDLGNLFGAKRDYAGAVEIYSRGLAKSPQNRALLKGVSVAQYRAGNFAEATKPAEVLADLPDATALDWFWLGTVHEAQGSMTAAVDDYEKAIDIDPNHWVAINNLSAILSENDPQRAVSLATRAAQIAPDVDAVQDTLGFAYFKAGNLEMAAKTFEGILSREPGNATANYRLGLVMIESGRKEEGRKLVETALSLDPEFRYKAEAQKLLAAQ